MNACHLKGKPVAIRILALLERRSESECWPWKGSVGREGYGRLRLNGREVSAHRLILEAELGRPLLRSECACHRCDNPPCCNPAHLFAGSHLDNSNDKHRKGRAHALRGEKHPRARVTDEQALLIRRLRVEGVSPRDLAGRFGLSIQATRHLLSGYSWRHLPSQREGHS